LLGAVQGLGSRGLIRLLTKLRRTDSAKRSNSNGLSYYSFLDLTLVQPTSWHLFWKTN